MRVLLAGGGSAGHTSPMIATADALRRRYGPGATDHPDRSDGSGLTVLCVGTERGLESRVIPEAGYELALIPPVPLPRRPNADLVRLPARLRAAVRAARRVIDEFGPDVVVGFGGYVSMPVYLAVRRSRTPLVVHEGNALPGVANRFGARFCTRVVATSFPGTRLPHAQYVGLPIRRAISTLDRRDLRSLAREHFGLDQEAPTLLVTGGSQGARRINQSVSACATDFAIAGVQVLHVKGPKGEVEVPERPPGAPPYVVVDYVDRMELAYAAADAMVGRAGSNSVTEAAAIGLPSVFVPLPIGNGEQALNAKAVVEAGGGVLVEDAGFTPTWVRDHVPALVTDRNRLERMSAAASGLIPRDADVRLADLVVAAAGGDVPPVGEERP